MHLYRVLVLMINFIIVLYIVYMHALCYMTLIVKINNNFCYNDHNLVYCIVVLHYDARTIAK